MSNNQYPQYEFPRPFEGPPLPPKKPHTGLKVIAVIASILVVIGVAAAAVGGGSTSKSGADVKPDDPITHGTFAPGSKKPVEQAPKVDCVGQKDRNAPCNVHAGKSFSLGSHTVLPGWKVIHSEYGDMFSVVGSAKNTGSKASTMFITVKFLKGDEVLGSVLCNTSELEPGQTERMNCIDDGVFGKYDRVTAEAAA